MLEPLGWVVGIVPVLVGVLVLVFVGVGDVTVVLTGTGVGDGVGVTDVRVLEVVRVFEALVEPLRVELDTGWVFTIDPVLVGELVLVFVGVGDVTVVLTGTGAGDGVGVADVLLIELVRVLEEPVELLRVEEDSR